MAEPPPTLSPAPLDAPLRAEFTYDLADFVEAQKSWATTGKATGKSRLLGRAGRSLFGWVLFIGLTIMLFLLLQNRPPPTPGAAPVPRPVVNDPMRILLPVVPWALIFCFIWFIVYRQIRTSGVMGSPGERPPSSLYEPGSPPPPPRPPQGDPEARSPVVWLLVLLPLIAVAYALFAYWRAPSDPSGAPFDVGELLLEMLPWIVIGGFLVFVALRFSGGGSAWQSAWDAQPALHRPRTMEADEQRIVIADAVDRLEHRWEAFTHVRETPNLFLLFTGRHSFHFIPKRAFANAADLDAFRELLRRTVAQRPAPAFPVLPVQYPPPFAPVDSPRADR